MRGETSSKLFEDYVVTQTGEYRPQRSDDVDEITRRIVSEVRGMPETNRGLWQRETRDAPLQTGVAQGSQSRMEGYRQNDEVLHLREVINRERKQFRDELDRAAIDWKDQVRTMRKTYEQQIEGLKKELNYVDQARVMAEEQSKTAKSVILR